MTDQTIAKTILQQLGGNKFVVMTGAKSLCGGENYLSFRIPGTMTRDRINYVKITLNPMDLYDVEYGVIRGTKYKQITRSEGTYDDMLRKDFEQTTGLRTSLTGIAA